MIAAVARSVGERARARPWVLAVPPAFLSAHWLVDALRPHPPGDLPWAAFAAAAGIAFTILAAGAFAAAWRDGALGVRAAADGAWVHALVVLPVAALLGGLQIAAAFGPESSAAWSLADAASVAAVAAGPLVSALAALALLEREGGALARLRRAVRVLLLNPGTAAIFCAGALAASWALGWAFDRAAGSAPALAAPGAAALALVWALSAAQAVADAVLRTAVPLELARLGLLRSPE